MAKELSVSSELSVFEIKDLNDFLSLLIENWVSHVVDNVTDGRRRNVEVIGPKIDGVSFWVHVVEH